MVATILMIFLKNQLTKFGAKTVQSPLTPSHSIFCNFVICIFFLTRRQVLTNRGHVKPRQLAT